MTVRSTSFPVAPLPARGVICLADQEHVAFGEISDKNKDNLYLYFNLGNFGEEWSAIDERLLVEVMENYFSQILRQDAKLKALRGSQAAAERKTAKTKYTELCSARYRNEINKLVSEISGTEKNIKKQSAQLTETCRQLDLLKAKLDDAPQIEKEMVKHFAAEYDQLLSNKNVEKVSADEGSVSVYTKTLILKDRRIGRFKISMHSYNGKITIENIDGRVGRCDHPHVKAGDSLCLGPQLAEVRKLVSRHEYALAFHFIWRRLNIYSGTPFFSIEHWPLASAEAA
jgi:hypothetical protein